MVLQLLYFANITTLFNFASVDSTDSTVALEWTSQSEGANVAPHNEVRPISAHQRGTSGRHVLLQPNGRGRAAGFADPVDRQQFQWATIQIFMI